MKRERLLEIITGEKEPRFVSDREYCIIDKCLEQINHFETLSEINNNPKPILINLSNNEKKLILICKGQFSDDYVGPNWQTRLKPFCKELFGWDADEDNNYFDYLRGMFRYLLKLYLKIECNRSGDPILYLNEIFCSAFGHLHYEADLPIERTIQCLCSLISNTPVRENGVDRFSLVLE